jgi:hypothetical protein
LTPQFGELIPAGSKNIYARHEAKHFDLANIFTNKIINPIVMPSKIESLEESINQEVNYFRVIWSWKWAVILIPLIAMITAKLIEQPIPETYETKASIVISGDGIIKPLSQSSFKSVAFLPLNLQKIIDQLSLKMADGTSMNQTTLKNQLKTEIPGNPASPVAPGFLFFIVRNENPDLAKKIADLWVKLVEIEAKKIEDINTSSAIKHLAQKKLLNLKSSQLNQHINYLFQAELKLAENKSQLSTYQKRLKTFSNSKVHLVPNFNFKSQNEAYTIIVQQDNTSSKKESSELPIETTLHSALKSLILNKELETEALYNKIHLLNTNIKKQEQELFELNQGHLPDEFIEIFTNWKQTQHKPVSSIASINYAPLIKTPIPREKYTHIFLAGIISFGFILLACVLKAHIDVMRQE